MLCICRDRADSLRCCVAGCSQFPHCLALHTVLLLQRLEMLQEVLEELEVLGLVDAKVVWMPPQVEDFAVLSGVGQTGFDTSSLKWLQEMESVTVWVQLAAGGHVDQTIGLARGGIGVVAGEVAVTVKEA